MIRTSRVLSPDRTWSGRWLREMHESRRVGLGTTVEYIERKFKTKAFPFRCSLSIATEEKTAKIGLWQNMRLVCFHFPWENWH